MSSVAEVLQVSGSQLVTPSGEPVLLRGVGLGGWMNMENFITGYPANEEAHREALRDVLGDKLYGRLAGGILGAFFGSADARYLRSLGLNLVRLPVNYRHFEDDARPFELKEEGFAHLDRVIDTCAREGIYTIIDLHAAPGYQNQDWHSDNPTHKALFWRHRHFQDRACHLWQAIARRYRDNPWVAGYNPLNEPGDESERALVPVYERLLDTIRTEDPDHVVFLEGNRYARDFHMFADPWPGVVYTVHDYALPGFVDGGPYPGTSRGEYVDRKTIERDFLDRTRYMRETGTPIWVGEFGPVYTGEPERDAMRYQVLRDQLDIYAEHGASWSLWTYKDIGLQGLVHAAPDSPWRTRVQPVVDKKERLGSDTWGTLDSGIQHIMKPLEDTFAEEFSDYDPFPFGKQWMINRLVRHILLAEPMARQFAERFEGLDAAAIDELAASFAFEQCVRRKPLARVLSDAVARP